jgi:predicted acetyltransferase
MQKKRKEKKYVFECIVTDKETIKNEDKIHQKSVFDIKIFFFFERNFCGGWIKIRLNLQKWCVPQASPALTDEGNSSVQETLFFNRHVPI